VIDRVRYAAVVRLAFLILALSSQVALAGEHDTTFATGFDVAPARVRDVAGYELPPGNQVTHVLVGRFEYSKYVMTGALLMRCNEGDCTWRRAEFGAADAIEVHGVVDLHGAPAAIPNRALRGSGRYTKIPGARAMKFPALVVRTRESKAATTETRVKLYVISLVDSDRGSVVLQDIARERYPSGRGLTRTYRLDKGDTKGALDIVATEQRTLDSDSRCLRPEPTEAVFALDGRHYRPKKLAPNKGC
jgi:hypothetical protein